MNPVVWTSAEASAVTGGVSTKEWYATGVSMNINDIKPGDLYIATKEDDLALVFGKGAVAAMVSGCRDIDGDWPLLKVGSVFEALQDLARAARHKTHAHIIAVQGRKGRTTIHGLLSKSGDVHQGGRHLSLGLAGLPEDMEYGLFGVSPAVQPDIAVITNPAATNRDTLFEMMPVGANVIVNADDEAFLSVIARAKAAGIQNIHTYGRHKTADARLEECIQADNGTRIAGSIGGEGFSFVVPADLDFDSTMVAGLLILKLTGKSVGQAIAFDQEFISGGAVTLIDPVIKTNDAQALFRVTNMIDLGFGRQTAMLDNLTDSSHESLTLPKKDLSIPRKLASLDFVYTSKKLSAVKDAYAVIRERHKSARIETITPEALAPGDFLVFKNIRERRAAIFTEALRLIPGLKPKPT